MGGDRLNRAGLRRPNFGGCHDTLHQQNGIFGSLSDVFRVITLIFIWSLYDPLRRLCTHLRGTYQVLFMELSLYHGYVCALIVCMGETGGCPILVPPIPLIVPLLPLPQGSKVNSEEHRGRNDEQPSGDIFARINDHVGTQQTVDALEQVESTPINRVEAAAAFKMGGSTYTGGGAGLL